MTPAPLFSVFSLSFCFLSHPTAAYEVTDEREIVTTERVTQRGRQNDKRKETEGIKQQFTNMEKKGGKKNY